MHEILAVASEDGWAYVRTDNLIKLIRPPYSPSTTQNVTKSEVEKAILTQGFEAPVPNRQFTDWSSLIGFLRDQIVAARAQWGRPLPNAGIGEAALALAPPDILVSFLDRVERELLPGELDHAQKLLISILKQPQVTREEGIHQRTVALLERVGDIRARSQYRPVRGNDLSKFPSVIVKYGAHAVKDLVSDLLEAPRLFCIR